MKKYLDKNLPWIILLVIGLVLSMIPVFGRIAAEENNKNYDLILEYTSVKELAKNSDMTIAQWLDALHNYGVSKIALGESSLRSLSEDPSIPIHAACINEITTHYGWEKTYAEKVASWIKESDDLSDALVIFENSSDCQYYMGKMKERFPKLISTTFEDLDATYIFISRQYDGTTGGELLNMCLAIDPQKVSLARSYGYQIIPKTTVVEGVNGVDFAKSFIKVLDEYKSPYFINSGDAFPGYDSPEGQMALLDYLKSSGIAVCFYEENDQSGNLVFDGADELLENSGYNILRVFNEWPYIQNRYAYCGYEGPEEITNSLFRAIAERNCKIVYLKAILDPSSDVSVDADQREWKYIVLPEAYRIMLSGLYSRLSSLGYKQDTVSPIQLKTPSIVFTLAEAFAVAVLLILLVDAFLDLKEKTLYTLHALSAIVFVGIAAAFGDTGLLVTSFFGGVLPPALAGIMLLRYLCSLRQKGDLNFTAIINKSLLVSILAIAFSFIGSILAASPLSRIEFMSEMKLYRGVKLMQLIPIALIALAYIVIFAYEATGAKDAVLKNIGERGQKGRFNKLVRYTGDVLNRPMKLSWFVAFVAIAIAGVFILAAGVYYIYRTGNSSNVSSIELQFRNMLETLLVARPRTKEILVGWPCLLLLVWALLRGLNFIPFVFALAASIGLVSVVNTFLHIRTPFLLSLLRLGWGILIGFVIGLILVYIAELIYRLVTGKDIKKQNV